MTLTWVLSACVLVCLAGWVVALARCRAYEVALRRVSRQLRSDLACSRCEFYRPVERTCVASDSSVPLIAVQDCPLGKWDRVPA